MADDGFDLARHILNPVPPPVRMVASIRTLLDTGHAYDAGITGRDGPESPDDGMGLRIVFNGRGSIPSVEFTGPDGCISLCGLMEIRAVRETLEQAERLASAMERR